MVRILAAILVAALAVPAGAASRFVTDRAGAPVRWERWGSVAFERARKEKRPIFLHIGFASSYESHRMHREAFLNGENVEALNAYFVPVLLDRMEHPEVAESYENGAAEWPLNLVLDAKLQPFASAGFMKSDELSRFLVIQANEWSSGVAAASAAEKPATGAAPFDIENAIDAIAKAYREPMLPRRPRPMTISFLLRYASRNKHEGIRSVALDTLRELALAPVRDQLGGGFHRATRDAAWWDPYFEKMLPDQALLAIAYLEAWQDTRDPELAYVARTTLDYVVRDLRLDHKGPFDASQDAYNFVPLQGPELVNGNFYLWNKDEITRLIGREPALKVFKVYGLRDAPSLPALSEWRFLSETHNELAEPLAKMLDVRQKRPQPSREFNVIAGWNGLAISALARAGAAFGEARYIDAATSAATAVTATHWNAKTKTLLRSEGNEALSEDYAMLVQGLLELFDAGQDIRWLELAIALQQRHDQLFWDASTGAYSKGTFRETDDETPAASSVAALNLLRLAVLTGNETWAARAPMIFAAFGGRMRANGAAYAALANAYELSLAPPSIVVITGDPRKKATLELLQSYQQRPEAMRALVLLPDKGPARERVTRVLPFTRALAADAEVPVAYVCARGECKRR